MKSSSEHIKYKLFGKYIYEKIVWIGKKLIFAEKRKEILKIKQRGITALNYQELKFSILFKTIDIYIKTYFNKRTLYEATYITGIGKCYIKVKYFCANHTVKTQNINKFLKFEIIPQTTRNKLFKFIISDCDFEIYFNLKMDFLNAREFLISADHNRDQRRHNNHEGNFELSRWIINSKFIHQSPKKESNKKDEKNN